MATHHVVGAERLGVPGEMEFEHRGVSQCADCDGPMYQGEEVVVVGGGGSGSIAPLKVNGPPSARAAMIASTGA